MQFVLDVFTVMTLNVFVYLFFSGISFMQLTLAEAMKMKARSAITTSDSGINTNITMNSRDVSTN